MNGNGITKEENTILTENFYALSKKQKYSYTVSLTSCGLYLQKNFNGSTKTDLIRASDIIGCKCMRNNGKSNECICRPVKNSNTSSHQVRIPYNEAFDCSAYLCVYAYILKNIATKNEKRDKMIVTLRFRNYNNYEDNLKIAINWKYEINSLIRTRNEDRIIVTPANNQCLSDRLLVIVNPKSGVGKGREIFQRRVAPVLVMADIDFELHITCMQNDARNLVRTSNIYEWGRGIVVLGGDGLMFEVINGLMERSDWQRAFEYLTLAIIPGGSGNGLAKSIGYETNEPYMQDPIIISTLNVVGGNSRPMDLVRVETLSQVVYSFLSVGWGFIADIDIESERLRILGNPRFTIWSIARLIGLKTYRARLSYSKVKNVEAKVSNFTKNSFFDCKDINDDDETVSVEFGMDPLEEFDFRERVESFSSVISKRSAFMSIHESSSFTSIPDIIEESDIRMRGPAPKIPPLSEPVPLDWEILEEEFVMIHASYLSHISEDLILAPNSKLNDGVIWLLIVKSGISRASFLQFLLALSTGNHLSFPYVQMIPVNAFRLEPLSGGSHIVVDGELLKHSPLQAEIMPGVTNVYARQKH
ncbi:sphingosine kinase 1-like isoform X2 [Daktulosphaira vitifoliae]|uniref:sphingosine kinase 1-like isoform X2 n=1 Tax=Daktulosphaira vitifoliae TaxID=58002 RepID=UPI0021A9AA30|nr:sphingosine kinase 1-like isoform X2 [Daktulosphaira vitifoliae]